MEQNAVFLFLPAFKNQMNFCSTLKLKTGRAVLFRRMLRGKINE